MKFPRNARIFRGQLDAAPFVSVFFLLVIFVLLFSLPGSLLHTAGVRVELPVSGNAPLPGTDHPTISVAMARRSCGESAALAIKAEEQIDSTNAILRIVTSILRVAILLPFVREDLHLPALHHVGKRTYRGVAESRRNARRKTFGDFELRIFSAFFFASPRLRVSAVNCSPVRCGNSRASIKIEERDSFPPEK